MEALFVRGEPTGVPHDGEMLGDGGEIAAQFGLEIRNTNRAVGENFCNLKPGGVGESFDDLNPIVEERTHYLVKMPNSGQVSRS